MLECEANLFSDGSSGNGINARLSNDLSTIFVSFDADFALEDGIPTTPCDAILSLEHPEIDDFVTPSVRVCEKVIAASTIPLIKESAKCSIKNIARK